MYVHNPPLFQACNDLGCDTPPKAGPCILNKAVLRRAALSDVLKAWDFTLSSNHQ